MFDFLRGKKTYFLLALGLVYVISGMILGKIDSTAGLQELWVVLVAMAVRAGIANGK